MGFRSGLEAQAAKQLEDDCWNFEYESENCKFKYYKTVPKGRLLGKHGTPMDIPKGAKIVKECTYTCDFVMPTMHGEDIYVETKGRFTPTDRAKHKLIRDQYSDLEIRFVFSSDSILRKDKYGTKFRCSDWCKEEGFEYHIVKKSDGFIIPRSWYNGYES